MGRYRPGDVDRYLADVSRSGVNEPDHTIQLQSPKCEFAVDMNRIWIARDDGEE